MRYARTHGPFLQRHTNVACRYERTSMPNRKVPWWTNKLETEIYTQHARTETSSAPATMACDDILLHGHTANWAVRRCYELHVYYHRLLEIAQIIHNIAHLDTQFKKKWFFFIALSQPIMYFDFWKCTVTIWTFIFRIFRLFFCNTQSFSQQHTLICYSTLELLK